MSAPAERSDSAVAAQLAAQAAELERSNAALEEFAYLCSHDLREPLRGIHTYASYLAEDHAAQLDDAGQDKLATLMRLTRRMDQLIDALLEYSRVGRTREAVRPTRIGIIVEDVLETLRPALREHGVEVRVSETLPRVVCDSVRVAEIFRNLISNAIKYRGEDAPRIEIGWRDCDAPDGAPHRGRAWPELFVRDNGIGIAPRHHRSIFRMFKRLHGREARGGGVGAGLALVERIVAVHGGRIRVESTPGEGSTFFFCIGPDAGSSTRATATPLPSPSGSALPVPGASLARESAPSARAEIDARSELRVIVVDDDELRLRELERSFASRPHPWQMRFTCDPQEALAAVSEARVDVIVSDLEMPLLPGDELLEAVRQHSPRTLRILTSACEQSTTVLRSIGPSQRFLPKPWGAEELREVIDSAQALRARLRDPLLAAAIGRIAKGPLFPGNAAELLEPTREIVKNGLHGAQRLAARLIEQLRIGTAQGVDVNAFWRRATRAAFCADRIAAVERARSELRSHAVLASLMHELGVLILARYAPDLLASSQQRAQDEQLCDADAERAIFGSTRDEVGAYVLGLWGMPDPIVEAVAFQRRPGDAASLRFTPLTITHVARALAHADEHGTLGAPAAGEKLPGLDIAYLERLASRDRIYRWIEYTSS